jgi:hypothetical protein
MFDGKAAHIYPNPEDMLNKGVYIYKLSAIKQMK